MKKSFVLLVLLAAAVMVLTACAAQPAPVVDSASAQAAQDWDQEVLIAEGRLHPASFMDHSFAMPGEIEVVLVQDGERVASGQALARLAAPADLLAAQARAEQELLAAQQALDELREGASLNLARARVALLAAQLELEAAESRQASDETEENQALLDLARAELSAAEDSWKRLEAGAGIDANQLAAAEARLNAAQAAAGSAQAALDQLELRSTQDGSVVDLDLRVGQRVAAGAPVVVVADYSGWVIKTDNLTETEVVSVRVGQEVLVTLDALPDQPLRGEVSRIQARYEEKRGDITYTVTAVLADSHPAMRWGMTAAVEFAP